MKRAVRWILLVGAALAATAFAGREPKALATRDPEAAVFRKRVLDAIESTLGEIEDARRGE